MDRILFAAMSLVVAATFAMAEPTPITAIESGITGTVTVSPTHGGPIRAGEIDTAPMRGAEFVVRAGDKTVASFTTDERGSFRVILPPGTYAVAKKGKPGLGGCGPFQLNVVAGQLHEVHWHCDSGMR